MRVVAVASAVALIACGASLRETCDLAARPGRWHVTAALYAPPEGTPYGFPGTCPAIDLTVDVPTSSADVQSGVRYEAASSELGSTDSCAISYSQGSPAVAGRTACGGGFDAGTAARTSWAGCFFQVGPADVYGDFTYVCRYAAKWERLD